MTWVLENLGGLSKGLALRSPIEPMKIADSRGLVEGSPLPMTL